MSRCAAGSPPSRTRRRRSARPAPGSRGAACDEGPVRLCGGPVQCPRSPRSWVAEATVGPGRPRRPVAVQPAEERMPDLSETPPAIATLALTKDYGAHRGIFDLDLGIRQGEVFGFLGPNGAGKTTTIKLLMGMIHPTRGTATIFGLDCEREGVAVKRRVGYLPGETPNFGGWRGAELVCDRVGIVREGNLVTVGTLAELIGVRARRIEIAFEGDPPLARLRSVPGLDQLDVNDHRVTAMLRGGVEHLLEAIAGQRVVDLHSREPSLEEIFLSYYSAPTPRA